MILEIKKLGKSRVGPDGIREPPRNLEQRRNDSD
jgi:hypothetical protein